MATEGEDRGLNSSKKWLANAATVLVVTVLAGLVVWWLTKPTPVAPDLSYRVVNTGSFNTNGQRLNFFTATITNNGSNVASGIAINFRPIGRGARFEETSMVKSPTRPAAKLSDENGQKFLAIPALKPSEFIKISFAIQSISPVELNVSGVAENTRLVQVASAESDQLKDKPATLFAILIGFLAVTVTVIRFLRRKISPQPAPANNAFFDTNNIGFALLHAGDLESARALFLRSFGRPFGEIPLSNYALLLALEGQVELAKNLHSVLGGWISHEGKHSQMIFNFNQSVIDALAGDQERIEYLRKALHDDNEQALYLKTSKVLQQKLPAVYNVSQANPVPS